MLTSPHTPSFGRLAAPFVAMALIVGACSAGATAAPVAPSTAPSTAASPSASAGGAASGSAYTITAQTGAVGKFLAGEDGKTLYNFQPDTATTSACNDACAANWPPFTLEAGETAAAGAGVSGTIATLTRTDGSMQVTYNGKPLYYFKNDAKAGDTNGQGQGGGKWTVAAP